MRRLLMEIRFNTAAGISHHVSTEQGKEVRLKARTAGLSSAERIKRLSSPLLRSMLCGQRRTGPKFTLVMTASLIYLGLIGNILFGVRLRNNWNPKCVKKSVNGGGGSVMVWRMFSAAATWQSECKCLSEPPSATCGSFPASISQSACNFHAGQYSCHTAKMG